MKLSTYLSGIGPGAHVLRVELSENNHTELGIGAQANITVLANAPRVLIRAPGNSTSWASNSAELSLIVENFTLNAAAIGGAPVADQGHYRVTVNGVSRGVGATLWFNVTGLTVGASNDIRVELVGNDGAPLASPAFDQITLRPAPGAPTLVLGGTLRGAAFNVSSARASFTVANFTLDGAAILQPPAAGRGHYMVWLDGALLGPGVANPILLTDLAAGNHTLVVELVNNDHTRLATRVVDWLSFEVTPGGPRAVIASPSDPASVNASSLVLQLAISNFTLSLSRMGQANVAGEGHWHVFVDGVDVDMGAATAALLTDLAAGPHNITLELRNNDHSELAWPVFDTLSITVLAGAPRITITSPSTPTATVASSAVELTFQVQGFTLSDDRLGGAPVPGEGHWQLFVDGQLRSMGASLTALASRLTPGTHEVMLELHDNDHSALPWPAFDRVVITVPDGSPFLQIMSPTPTTSLPLNYTGMRVAVANFSVVEKPDQTPVAGEGHWHIFLDGAFYDMAYVPTAVLRGLAAGTHTVRAVLVGNDHNFLSPLVADETEFTVGGARAAIRITSPADGGVLYGTTATMVVALENFTIAPSKVGQAPEQGEGHWHFLLDGTYVNFVTGLTYDATGLVPGNHTLTARLYNHDHSPLEIRIEAHVLLQVSGAPRISIASPGTGLVTTDTTLALTVAITNFTLDPVANGTANAAGRGHYHVYVDGTLSTMEADLEATVSGLAVGPHIIRVELVNRDHTPLSVPNGTAEIIVTVQPSAPPPGFLPGANAAAALVAIVAAAASVVLARKRRAH